MSKINQLQEIIDSSESVDKTNHILNSTSFYFTINDYDTTNRFYKDETISRFKLIPYSMENNIFEVHNEFVLNDHDGGFGITRYNENGKIYIEEITQNFIKQLILNLNSFNLIYKQTLVVKERLESYNYYLTEDSHGSSLEHSSNLLKEIFNIGTASEFKDLYKFYNRLNTIKTWKTNITNNINNLINIAQNVNNRLNDVDLYTINFDTMNSNFEEYSNNLRKNMYQYLYSSLPTINGITNNPSLYRLISDVNINRANLSNILILSNNKEDITAFNQFKTRENNYLTNFSNTIQNFINYTET